MKRLFRFLGLALVMLSIFACSLEIPETVEIKGNPKLEFAANMDFSKVFGDIISDGFGGSGNDITVLKAPNSESPYQTLVIRMPLFNPDIPNPVGQTTINIGEAVITIDPDPAVGVTVGSDQTLINDSQPLPLGGLLDYLEGFTVDTAGIFARVYFDGSKVVNAFKMAMSFGDDVPLGTAEDITRQSSEIAPGDEEYAGTKLPSGGSDVSNEIRNLLLNQGDSTVNYKIDLKNGSTINGNMFVNASISAELVIWFPLVFNAGPAGAELKMDELNSAGDFISQLAEAEILESVNVKLTMDGANPFDNAYLRIKDGNSDHILVDDKITDSINFELEKPDINYINNRDNFKSVLSIFFPAGGTLKIPKTLKISTISIDAKVSVDLLEDD